MRIVAAIFADFAEANPGGPSQLQTDLAGRSVIGRTLARVAFRSLALIHWLRA